MIPLTDADFHDEADPNPPVHPMREPRGPVGPFSSLCDPCGHTWYVHDDYGCLWNLCACGLPGERK
jgi:hypothetical protein